MQDKAFEVLNEMISGSYGDDIKPGLPSFTAGMLVAMQNQDWNQVLALQELMAQHGVLPSSITLQCVVLANVKNGNIEGSIKAIEKAIDSKTTEIDGDTFMLCAKILLPQNHGGDLNALRNEMRLLANSSPDDVSEAAMELNKLLRECQRQDQRRPTNIKSQVMVRLEREKLWREALQQTVLLSRML